MPIHSSVEIYKESSCIITLQFHDEKGQPCTPVSAVNWKLTNSAGTTIVSGSVTPTGDTAVITLTGTDLMLPETSKSVLRRVEFSTTYNSDAGTNLSLKDYVTFTLVKE